MTRVWWRILTGTGVAATLAAGATLWFWRHPEGWLPWLIRQAEPRFTAQSVDSLSTHALRFRGVRVGETASPYFIADEINLSWDWRDLLFDQRLGKLSLDRPRASLLGLEKAFPPQPATSAAANPTRQRKGWFSPKLDELSIHRGVVALDNLHSPQLSIPITLGADKPLVIQKLNLETTVISAAANDILITSPYDALSPVLAIQSIGATFTWDGLLHQHILSLRIVKPVAYLGPDLFWYGDALQKAAATAPARSPAPEPWVIDHFELNDGQLALNLNGVPNFTFPFLLQSHSEAPLRLANFTELPLQNKIVILPGDLDYPDYGVRVKNLNGFLAFNLPPSHGNARNVVPTVQLEEISWHEARATDGRGWITFDRDGIYGGLDARAYEGHIGAGFSFLFQNLYPWSSWIYAEKVAMAPLLKALAPDYFHLDGRLVGKLQLNAQGRDIRGASGQFTLIDRGHMQVKSIDQVLAKLPTDWPAFKQDTARIILNAFRDYDYTAGKITGSYTPPVTRASLRLDGKQGARHFDFSWKMEPPAPTAVAETTPKAHTSAKP